MDKKQLEYYKQKLLQLKKELISTLRQKYAEAANLGEGDGKDFGDEAYSLYAKNIVLGRVETDALKLKLVEQALQRIESKSYGICIECEDDIEEKRLEYVPFARYCTECKSELEKTGKITM